MIQVNFCPLLIGLRYFVTECTKFMLLLTTPYIQFLIELMSLSALDQVLKVRAFALHATIPGLRTVTGPEKAHLLYTEKTTVYELTFNLKLSTTGKNKE